MTTSSAHADLPFAKDLFEAANRLRDSVESSEYKHLVLGLLFVRYVSDSFERQRARIEAATRAPSSDLFTSSHKDRTEILEDRDEYSKNDVFWVPDGARYQQLVDAANLPELGKRIDRALEAIGRENEQALKGVLPTIYARAPLPNEKLAELVNLVGNLKLPDSEEQERDLLGRTYEYFIRHFARAEGHRGGEFYTPSSVVELLVEMLEPTSGRVFEPACGSGGLLIQSAAFVSAHGGRTSEVAIYGQENNQATWRIGKMNLAIHGISADIALGNSLLDPKHRDLRADFVMANPPFNMSKWGAARVKGDARWKYGAPPDSNANYAWIQHFVYHLAPKGRAGFVMANGSLTDTRSGQGEIRRRLIEADIVDCIVALPSQLFFTTGIPVCLWFLDRDKHRAGGRDRRGKTLFIDARRLGAKISRTQIELTEAEVRKIATTYRAFRGTLTDGEYADKSGFCAEADLSTIERAGAMLSSGRYVGTEDVEVDGDVAERIASLRAELVGFVAKGRERDNEIARLLKAVE